MTPRFIHDGKDLRATVLGDAPDRLIVTYDHWGADKAGFPPLRAHSSYAALGFSHLHLVTRRNDWFLNRDLPGALHDIAEFAAPFAHKLTLAFSMGGFGALMVSRVVAFDRVMLVSPHSTFSPDHPPHDDRFAARGIALDFAAMAHDIVLGGPKSKADCAVLYDSSARFDAAHAAAVAGLFRAPRLVDLKGGGHPATTRLTANGKFDLVVQAITGQDFALDALVSAHCALATAAGTP
ncbi:MAG: hypothetical protein AUK37_07545 [Rhodobacterales bacterium CG2_30_65_12]|nr:MAG: hypothetical protein AUK37_07545 [Rhodobacterales bacterium CG2_30_65_12]